MNPNQNWFDVKGDETYALDWPLDENSHVWEIGGFAGRWAQQIWDKFHCNITIFEPQLWAVERMAKQFNGNNKIVIIPQGLWTQSKSMPLGDYETDGASLFKPNHPKSDLGRFIDYTEAFKTHENFYHKGIDLCLMNIEGAEYELIPAICGLKYMSRINYFWCQFHPGLVGAQADKLDSFIEAAMNNTHEKIWEFYPTAVAWRRK